MNEDRLVRTLGMKDAIAITTGTVVGVGLFTVGANCVGIMGSGVVLCTLIAMLVCIYPTYLYAEMGAALPYAGGTYEYAKRAINRPVANICSWHYIIAIIATCAGESLAFSNYFTYILNGLGLNVSIDNRIIAFILMAFFIFINVRGIKVSARLQNGFVWFFWAVSLVWMVYMIKNVDVGNFLPQQLVAIPGVRSYVLVITYLWWCYAGFETAVGMGGEVKYPQINIPRALILGPFLIFVINAMFQFFLIGIVPTDQVSSLADAAAPYAHAMEVGGYVGFPLIFLCLGITFGGDMSTMNPGVAAPARYLFQMGNDRAIPAAFGKIHPKYKTPYVAVIAVGVVAFLLILTGSITVIAQISLLSVFWCYIIGFISFIMLRVKEPELKRPFRARGGIFGAVISIIFYLIMVWSVGLHYFLLSLIITAACLLFYYFYSRKHQPSYETMRAAHDEEAAALELDVPSPQEKAAMDKEYTIWRVVVFSLFALTLILYAVMFLI